jgi:hypothetical protein
VLGTEETQRIDQPAVALTLPLEAHELRNVRLRYAPEDVSRKREVLATQVRGSQDRLAIHAPHLGVTRRQHFPARLSAEQLFVKMNARVARIGRTRCFDLRQAIQAAVELLVEDSPQRIVAQRRSDKGH